MSRICVLWFLSRGFVRTIPSTDITRAFEPKNEIRRKISWIYDNWVLLFERQKFCFDRPVKNVTYGLKSALSFLSFIQMIVLLFRINMRIKLYLNWWKETFCESEGVKKEKMIFTLSFKVAKYLGLVFSLQLRQKYVAWKPKERLCYWTFKNKRKTMLLNISFYELVEKTCLASALNTKGGCVSFVMKETAK